jgi:hypothetical protein
VVADEGAVSSPEGDETAESLPGSNQVLPPEEAPDGCPLIVAAVGAATPHTLRPGLAREGTVTFLTLANNTVGNEAPLRPFWSESIKWSFNRFLNHTILALSSIIGAYIYIAQCTLALKCTLDKVTIVLNTIHDPIEGNITSITLLAKRRQEWLSYYRYLDFGDA